MIGAAFIFMILELLNLDASIMFPSVFILMGAAIVGIVCYCISMVLRAIYSVVYANCGLFNLMPASTMFESFKNQIMIKNNDCN